MQLHLNTKLISRLDEAEFSYTRDRMQVVQSSLENKESIGFIEMSNIRGVMAPTIPNEFFNRILLSGEVSRQDLDTALHAYENASSTPVIEVSPGAISGELGASLSKRGFAQTEFHPIFVQHADNVPAQNGGTGHVETQTGLVSRRVTTANDLKAFADIYTAGWKTPAFLVDMLKRHIEDWIDLPQWHLYLAFRDDTPVSCAVLYACDGMTYLADATTPEVHRGKGGQSALLRTRIRDAKELGAEYIFSRADFASVSHRNLENAGINTAYTRSVWKRVTSA